METYKTVPENKEVFGHEAGTAKLMIFLSWFFVLISAVSVTSAWRVFLTDLLKPLGAWQWPALIVWGLIFVLPLEVMIFELSKYFWRSILHGFNKGEHRNQFVTVTIMLMLLLTYSFVMSQKATKLAMHGASKKYELMNTEKIDQDYNTAVRANASKYAEEADAIDSKYSAQEKAVSLKYESALDSLQREFAYYESLVAKGKKYGNRVTQISRKMAGIESEKGRQLAALAVSKSGELSKAQESRINADNAAQAVKDENIAILKSGNKRENAGLEKFANVFSTIVSLIAAFAVIFVFLLARFIEQFYFRAGIKKTIFLENWDLRQGNAFFDLIKYPFIAVNRRLSVKVAGWYEKLPNPPAPKSPQQIYNPGTMTQTILNAQGQPMSSYTPGSSVPAAPVSASSIAATPSPGGSAPTGSSFSLKDSGPSASLPEKAYRVPSGLENLVIEEFLNSPDDPSFYAENGYNPNQFRTAFDYIAALKKGVRNSLKGATATTGKKATKVKNAQQFAGRVKELARLYVGIELVPGPSIRFDWIDPAQREGLMKEAAKYISLADHA
jgi:hypothetical protein